jgi:hypothetical protein
MLQNCSYGLDKTQENGKRQPLLNQVNGILVFIKERAILNCLGFSRSPLLKVKMWC